MKINKLKRLLLIATLGILNINLFAGFGTMNPVQSASHITSIPSKSQDITLSWEQAIPNNSDTLAGYYYLLDTNADTIMPNVVSTRGSISSSALGIDITTSTLSGDLYFHLAPYASSGNIGATLHYGPIKIDTIAPILSISPQSGTFSSIQTVSISMSDLNPSLIYYTTDGTEPTTQSTVYTNAIGISQTTTLRVFAKDRADNNISTTEIYTLNISSNVANFGNEVANGTIISTSDVPFISIVGDAITHYKYKIDTASFSQQIVASQPIDISSLSKADHTITVIGYDGETWQSESSAKTLSFTVSDNPESDTLDRAKNLLVEAEIIEEEDEIIYASEPVIENDGSVTDKITVPILDDTVEDDTVEDDTVEDDTVEDDTVEDDTVEDDNYHVGSMEVEKTIQVDGRVSVKMTLNGKLIIFPTFPIGSKVYVIKQSNGVVKMTVISALGLNKSLTF